MNRPQNYQTNQSKIILEYLKSTRGSHLTVKDIIAYFQEKNEKIGMTTVYRYLDKFIDEGLLENIRLMALMVHVISLLKQNMKIKVNFILNVRLVVNYSIFSVVY